MRVFTFSDPSGFKDFFDRHGGENQEGDTLVLVSGKAFTVDSDNHVKPANTEECHRIEVALKSGTGSVQSGDQTTAQQLTALLTPAGAQGGLHIPPIIELRAPTIFEPNNPREEHLNELAQRTTPVPAYEIKPLSRLFYSPIATNVQVTEEGSTNPAGYYAPINRLTHRAQSTFPIFTGTTPTGSVHRCEAFWMVTQEKEIKEVLDLTPPEPGAVGGSHLFDMPYYPKNEGETLSFGCIKVKNTTVDTVDKEMKFEVTNTKTGKSTEVSLVHSLWDTPGLVEPEQLVDIAERIQLNPSPNTIVLSENYREIGMAAIAEILMDKAAEDAITTENAKETLEDAILQVRQDIGPEIVTNAEELKLLEDYIQHAVSSNMRE